MDLFYLGNEKLKEVRLAVIPQVRDHGSLSKIDSLADLTKSGRRALICTVTLKAKIKFVKITVVTYLSNTRNAAYDVDNILNICWGILCDLL